MIELRTEGRIAVLAFAAETRNLLDPQAIARLDALVDEIAASDAVDAVVVVSDREEFILGGDLDAILREEDAAASFETTYRLTQVFRRIELSRKPYVAAINATALGGGFELALACHRRIVADAPSVLLGLLLGYALPGQPPGSSPRHDLLAVLGSTPPGALCARPEFCYLKVNLK